MTDHTICIERKPDGTYSCYMGTLTFLSKVFNRLYLYTLRKTPISLEDAKAWSFKDQA
jgi:hypothetical protein